MCDAVGTVLVCHPLEDALASVIIEIDVDIGHRNTVRIQKAFEEEIVLNGVDVGDAEAVGYDATGGGSATRPHDDTHFASGGDEVLDDEKVAGKSHRLDGLEFEVETFGNFVGETIRPALLGSQAGEVFEIVGFVFDATDFVDAVLFVSAQGVEIVPKLLFKLFLRIQALVVRFTGEVSGNGKHRHDRLRVEGIFFDFLRNLHSVSKLFRIVGKYGGHFIGRLEPFLPRVAEAFDVRKFFARVNAEQYIMSFGIILQKKMNIVCGDDLDAEFSPQLQNLAV